MAYTIDQNGNMVNADAANASVSPLTVNSNSGKISNPTPSYAPNYKSTAQSFSDSILNPPPKQGPQLPISIPQVNKPAATTHTTHITVNSAPPAEKTASTTTATPPTTEKLGSSGNPQDLNSGNQKSWGGETPSGGGYVGTGNNLPTPPTNNSSTTTYWKDPSGSVLTVKPGGIPSPGAIQTDENGNAITASGAQPGPGVSEIYNKYGVSGTPTGAPTTSPVNLPDYSKDPNYLAKQQELDQNLLNMKNAIAQKYQPLNQQAVLDTSNETAQTTGGLYKMGDTNPLSSGVNNIKNLGEKNLSIRQANLAASQSEEEMNAQNQIFNQKQAVTTQAQELAKTQEEAIKANNAQIQQNFENSWTNINNTVANVKAGQEVGQTEQNNNLNRLNTMLTDFGSKAFDGVPATELDNIAKAAGLPVGSLQKSLQTMKEKELYGKLHLQQMFDGSLVNVSIGADGKPVMDVLLPGSMDKITAGIQSGMISPDLSGYSDKQKVAITNSLVDKGYNLAQAQQTWKATSEKLATMNANQQTRLSQSITSASGLLDKVESLNKQAQDALSKSGYTDYAKVQKSLALRGAYGLDVKSIFTQLDSQVAETVADFATIYQGGNQASNESLHNAEKILNSDWDFKTLSDNLKLVRDNISIRKNAMDNFGVAGTSSAYVPNQNNSTGQTSSQDVTHATWANLLNQ